MNKSKRIGRMVLCLIVSFVMIMTLIPRLPAGMAFAADGDEPLPTNPTKARKSNNNGTYKIELSITGDAQTNTDATKANVIIIMDTSGSMTDDAPTANTSPTGRYGYRNESYINLYTRNANGTYSQVTNNTTPGPVYYRTGNYNYEYHEYTTTRYTSNQGESTRLAQTKTAVNSLIDTLLAQNQNISDMIEIAYMTFGSSAAYRTPSSATGTGWVSGTNGTTLKNTVSTTNANTGQQAGTNWDDALHDAKALADAKNDGDKTYIVFFTDGEPTFNNGGVNAQGGHNHGNSQQGGGDHTTNADIESAEYEAALLNTDDYDLYGIFAYGDPENYTYMTRVLTKGNGSPDGFGFYADNQSSLNEAFAAIASAVSAAVGVEQVTLSDGTTSSVTQTSGDISNLLSVDESSYEYWMSWTVAQNGTFEVFQNGKTTTYTATQNGNNIVITWTENGEAKTVTYEGTKDGNIIKIKWDRATEFYNYEPPEAEFKNNAVNWDLSEVGEKGTLLDGVTYSYSFDVYPAQDTYDIIAQLKNGDIEYGSLDENIKKYIKPDGHGGYTLETNTAATYSYYDAITETTHSGTMDNPPAVTTDASQMTIKKTWENSIDDYDKEPLNMSIIQKTGSEVINYGTVSLNDGNDYQNSIYIATGLLTTTKDAQGNVTDIKVLDTGHDYYMAEPVGVSYHWDLIAETVHPMLIDGVLTTLVKADEPSGMAGKNYYKEGNTEYYRLTDGVYKVKESGATVSAENKRRNTLLLTKELDANGFDIPEGTKFTFDMTVDNNIDNPSADDEDVWFAVYKKGTTSFETNNIVFDDTIVTGAEKEIATIDTTRTDTVSADNVVSVSGDHLTYRYGENQYTVKIASGPAADGSYTYYVYEVIGIDEDAGTVTYTRYGTEATAPYEGMDGNNPKYWTGFWHAPSGAANVKAELEEGQIVRYTNLPIGSTYTFVEEEPTDGFVYEKAEATVKTGSAGSEGTDPKATVTDAQRKVAGTMNVGNSIYKTTYTNNMDKVDITATKVWEDNDNQDGLRTAVTLHLNKSVDGGTPTVVTGQDKTIPKGATGDALTVTWEDLSTVENGKTVTYSVTEDEIDGYTTEITKDENGANAYIVTNTHTPEMTQKVAVKVWDDMNNANNKRPTSIKFTLMNGNKEVKSITLDGTPDTAPTGEDVAAYESKAWEATFVNLPKFKDGEEINYTVKEDPITGYVTTIDGLTVTNTYDFGDLEITKTVVAGNGDPAKLAAKEFEFTVNLKKGSEALTGTYNYTITDASGTTVSTGTISNGGTLKLKDGQKALIKDLPNGATYEVTEATEAGYTTTKTGDTGTIASNDTKTAAFTNTYNATPIKAQIPVKKNVTPENSGVDDITGKFTFTLAAGTNTAGEGVTTPMPSSNTVPCGADGVEVKFGEMTFNAPGTYTYTVSESVTGGGTSVDGIGLDSTGARTITVIVSDDGNGKLTAVVNGNATVEFNNPYTVTSINVNIPIEKILEVPDGLEGPDDITGEYTFTLAGQNGAPMPAAEGGNVITNPDATGGSASFGPISVNAPGTYTYTITETGEVAGVTNDTTATKTVTVNVVDNHDGTMSYTINKADDEEDDVTTFTNKYNADSVKASIPVEKLLTGENAPDITGKYTFTIADDTADDVVSPLPTTKSYTNPDADGGMVSFGEIEFTAPGTYVYVITESGTVEGVVNDPAAATGKKVTVTVEDGKEGKLVIKSITSTTDSPLQFTNSYHEASISIPVTKTLNKEPANAEGPVITGKYTFAITGSNGAPMPETKSIDGPLAEGAMAFGPITFKEPGTYTYTVTETGTVSGVTNDPDAKVVKVVVTRGDDGELSIAYDGNTSFDFVNTYKAEPVKASFPVKKIMEVTGEGPKSWSYTINVAAVDGAPEAASMTGTVTNTKDTATFGEFTFDAPGTYTYKVTETGTVAGVTNDPAAEEGKTVTIKVKDNTEGKLVIDEISSTTESPLTFTNTYSYQSTTATIQVHKDLVAENPKVSLPNITDKYTFTLTAGSNTAGEGVTTPMPAAGGETVKNPAKDGGTAAFGTITFEKPGTYTYVVTESGTVTNVTNDPDAATGKTVTVTVVDGQEGKLVATVNYPDEDKAEVDFTNTYKAPPVEASFPVQKVLSVPDGFEGPETWEYTFTVDAKDGAPAAKTMTAKVDQDDDTATFGPFTYTEPGTYTYTVTETGTVAGVTNDREATTGKTVTVTVRDNGDGTLTATPSVSDEAPLKFTNTYNAEPVKANFPVKKVLSVPDGFEGPAEWTYTIKVAANGTAPTIQTMTGTVNQDTDTVTFGDFTFTEPGTYTYTVTETGTVKGVTNDKEATTGKTVTVIVTDEHNGKLKAEVSSTEEKPLSFTNTYAVEEAKTSFPVKKNMVVPQGLTGPAEWSYTINVTANSGAPEAETMTGTVTQTNDTVTFGEFTYKKPGTYTYTITETGTVAGVDNDAAATSGKVVTVKVVDNGDGSLTATADYTTDKPLEFKNTYHVAPTTAKFPVTKEVVVPEGFAGPDDWEFTVNVAGTPAAQTMTGKVTKAEPTVTFGDFTYTAPGEYTYTVTETGTVAGITNDEAATTGKTVTVNVVDNGDGTLTATPTSTEAKPLTFTNNYVVPPITASIPVEKILSVAEGLNAPSIKNKFTFTLTSAEGTPMPGTTSYTNPDADGGDMTFGDITFDKPGTYTYTVTETGEVAGVSAVGATEKTVEISVVDNKDGTMTATVNGGKKLQFTNEYKVGEATAEIPVNKILEVAEGLTPDSIEGKFTFTLTAADGTPMPKTTSFTNPDATGGKVTFGGEDDPITFTKPGTYTYTVTETGSADGVTNDKTASKTVKVVVTDNGDGTMTAVVNEGKELDFTNTYTVEPTKASFPVEKVLEVPEGLNPDSIKNKFTFTLTAEDGTPMPETKSYTNPDADGGTVTFGEIEYTEPGTYTYTVTETGEVDGITNDTEGSKTVTVTVVDNGDGTLTATPSSTKEKPLQFTNKYEVEPTTAKFPVKKVLEVPEGLTPNSIAQKFTFTVTAEDGTPMPPVVALQNPDATGGTVTFGEIEYTVPGTYTYTVTESGSADGVTNDETLAKTVIVTVTDNGDGTLTAVASSTDEKPLTFTNKYSVEPTTAKFPVQKIMEVPEYLDGPESWSYTINVEAQKGAPAADTMTGTVTDKADTVTFGDFTYKEPGTYTYVVTENGTYKGVTNDEAAASGKTVTVTVVDNGDGTLTATADYTDEKPLQFTNKYDAPPIEVPTSAYLKKTVVQMPPKTDETEFKFTLQPTEEGAEPLEGTVKATKAGDYTIDFGKLTFDKPGTYTYTLTEVLDGLDGGWVVTGSPATVTIKVTDNKEGELVAEVTGATISNNFETVKVEGEKIWNDDEYFDENGEPIEGYERPDVTINLMADGEEIDEVVVTAKDNWKFSFVDLPKHKDHGTEIVYTITEDDVEAFEGKVADYTVENTPQRLEEDQLNPTELTIKKVDAETGNVIPTGATFVLKQGDTEIEYTTGEDGTVVIPFEQGGNENGEYTLYEKESPEGYELTDKTYTIVVDKEFDHVEIKESLWTWFYNLVFNKDTKTLFDKDTQTLTVENPPVKTNIEAEKVWNDNDDKDGVRPDSITLTLTGTAGGEEVYRDVKTVTEGDDWKAEWNDLATYVDGNEVTFEMTEAKVKGYDTDDIVLEKGEDGNYSVIVKNNHQSEPKKEVFTGSSKQSVDGEMVEAGQELTYEITYVNTTGKTVEEVTITDKIPENTEFVEADNEGVFKNGKVTWKIYDVTDGEEVVVTVVVKVKDSANGQALKNKAVVNDGTNKYESNEVVNKTPVKHDPPVKKVVKGDTPKKADKFKFALTQVSTTADVKMPMPEGAKGKTAYVEVKAGQKKEFGEIVFTEPGTYVYKVKEVNTKLKNYKYDSSEYTLTYVLEDNDGDLDMTLTVTKNGKTYDHSVFKFTNIYDEPVKTGDTTQVLPYMLMFTAALLGLILVFRRRKAVRK